MEFLTKISPLLMIGVVACNSGTLHLELTDSPPDIENISEVTITVNKLQVHVVNKTADDAGDPEDLSIDDDHKWVSVKLASREFDLIALQNDVTATLGALDLPESKITQIRLFIDPDGTNQVVLDTNQVCPLDLVGVDSKGIKINHPFKALAIQKGKDTHVVLDMDLRESVSKADDCSYELKPVLKIKRSFVQDENH